MKTSRKMVYVTPKVEVVVIDLQGVLCVSGGDGNAEGFEMINIGGDTDPFNP